ncbi:MAG: IclR family transcriptional regulator C-terminal domain-containing protein [Acidobacteriota bacterium]
MARRVPPSATRSKQPPVRPASGAGDPDYMLSLARGLSVIRAFAEGRPHLTVADAARLTGMSRAAARRCLYTLSALGYATSIDGAYTLTPAVLALGYTYIGSTSLARVAQPVLERVSDQLHESFSLAVADGDDIVYLARAATRRILSIGLSVGSRLPAACTSMGRVLLAFGPEAARAAFLARVRLPRHTPYTIVDKAGLRAELERVRQQGFAIVDQELELGLRSLAVPVRRPDGAVVAAINVGVQAGRVEGAILERKFLPALREAAAEIGTAARHVRA